MDYEQECNGIVEEGLASIQEAKRSLIAEIAVVEIALRSTSGLVALFAPNTF